MGLGKIIAIIGGVAVGAVGAYNYSSTGCPLGTTAACETGDASVQTVAGQSDDACPLGCAMESEAATLAVAATEASSCCSAEAVEAVAESCCSKEDGVALLSVSATTEADACCEGEKAECCGECAESDSCEAEACEAKSDACEAEAKEGCCQSEQSDG